ncbi:tyrosine-type recombinase/integrase [Chloroflexota bacterium]
MGLSFASPLFYLGFIMAIRIENDKENDSIRQSIKLLIEEYTLNLEAGNRSQKTISWYLDILDNFFFKYLPSQEIIKPIDKLGREEVRSYIKHLQSSNRWPNRVHQDREYGKLSLFTIQGKIRALKAFWGWLFKEEHIDSNPLAGLPLPKVPKNMIVILEKERIIQLLKAIDQYTPLGARNYMILLLLIDTGLRISELTRIQMTDITLTQGYIKVIGKGQKERPVPFSTLTKKELIRYIKLYRPSLCGIDSAYLFPVKDGEHISVNSMQQAIRRLAQKAGMQDVKCHPHIFRHTFATMFSVKGGSPEILQLIMGHESFQTTQKYLHPQPQDLRKQHIKYSPLADLLE